MEDEEAETLIPDAEKQRRNNQPKGKWGLVFAPVYWIRNLSDQLHWSFILSVVVVHGISQGLGVGLGFVSIKYYMKDEQKLLPSEAQVFFGIIQIPWIVKPLWGFLTDSIPVCGYRRRPYFLLAGN